MDVRLIILAVTFALLIVSAVSFVSSLVRARRIRRLAGPLQEVAHVPAGMIHPVDTSLVGLTVDVDPDSPSAALLTPIRTGEWRPPEILAPTTDLSAVSLTQRIAELTAIAQIPEPSFLSESHEPWMAVPELVAAETPEPAPVPTAVPLLADIPLPDAAPAAAPLVTHGVPLESILPEVYVENELEEPADTEIQFEPVIEDDFDAQIHALLPEPTPAARPDLASTAVPASEPTYAHEFVAEVVPEPVPEPAPVAVATPESASVSPSLPVETPGFRAIPPLASEPASAPVAAPESTQKPAVAPVVVEEPVAATVPVQEFVPEPEKPLVEEYWEDLLREQQMGVSVAPTRVPAERPEVRVTAAEVPVVEPEAEPVLAPARPPRPVARVRTAEGTIAEFVPGQQDAAAMRAHVRTAAKIPELTMEAPVEMWFGDARVGVKAGTATYDRFRKYADVLLGDLRASGVASR